MDPWLWVGGSNRAAFYEFYAPQILNMTFEEHYTLLVKNNYYEISTLNAKKGPMKTTAQNRSALGSANSDGSIIAQWMPWSMFDIDQGIH